MGLGIVLIFWAVVGSILAGIGSALYGTATAFVTRGVNNGRRRVILAAYLLPILCLGWGAAVFVFQAVVNESLLHRDLGIGDTWHAPLPNGYQILMIDVTDQGWVYNPKTQPGSAVGEQDDAVAGIRTLQIAGRYILGGTDSKSLEHRGQENGTVDAYFLLDTKVGKHTTFDTFEGLREAASALKITPHLEPISSVYSKYRGIWFDVVTGLMFFTPPVAGTGILVIWIIRLRRSRRLPIAPNSK